MSDTMKTVDFLTAQAQLAKLMRLACESDTAVVIDGLGKDEVVMISRSEYQRLLQKNQFETITKPKSSSLPHARKM